MFERVQQMIIKEFTQALRDPKMRAIVFVAPLIQLFLFGYAVSTDVKNVKLAVLDLDNSIESREVISRFEHSGYFQVVERITEENRIAQALDIGSVQAVVRFNHGFGAEQQAGRTAEMQILLDGTDSNSARIIMDYAGRIARAYTTNRLQATIVRLTGTAKALEPVSLESRAWFNENLESRNFFIPGVIATLTALITLILTSMAVVREKEIGTLEQMLATPITQLEFMLGKTVPSAIIGYIDVALITLVGIYWFDVPMRGSLPLLFLSVTFYLMSTIGAGLLISTLSQTQQQAMISIFFFFNPAMLLSGFVFPIANMPEPIQWLTYLNPLRYILIIVRGMFLKGIGIDILWPQLLGLLALGVATLTLATLRMRKTLA
ncbi:MAG TPA: ABC transporter permease [Candidatus Hydrogenedentes bacterium]|nr:ABC transporter permease [Candidatus Hydrogenedentota bacterium]